MAGKRTGARGGRNGWPWTLDAIDAIRPTWVICENVQGLTFHRADCDGRDVTACPGCYWLGWIIPQFERRFASVQVATLDAADYGVPQRRHRAFLVAGPRPIRWPAPTHADPEILRQALLFGARLLPWVSVRQALRLSLGLSLIGQRTPETAKGGNRWHGDDEPAPTIPAIAGGISVRVLDVGRPAPTLRANGSTDASGHEGGHAGVYVLDPRHPPAGLSEPTPSVRSGGDGHSAPPMYLRTEMNGASAWPDSSPAPTLGVTGNTYLHSDDPGVRRGAIPQSRRPMPLDSPADAVQAGSPTSNHAPCVNAAPTPGLRRLSVEEVAILQDFPPGYPFQGTATSRYRQVGNAVPPPLARVLGEAVRAAHEEPGIVPARGERG